MLAMVQATHSGRIRPARLACLVLVLATGALETGCARIASFRKKDQPAFGTDTASTKGDGRGHSQSGDLYADLVGRPKTKVEGEAVALAGIDHKTIERAAPDRRPAEANPEPTDPLPPSTDPQVALQAPVTLPSLPDAMAPRTARQGKAVEVVADSPTRPNHVAETRPEASHPEPPAGAASQPTLDSVLAQSRQALDALSTYQVKMNHQERVAGVLKPAEDVVLSIRRRPKAVRIEWLDGSNKGREVIYAADANGGLMHVKMVGPLGALPRLSLAPDSPLATANSRHPITEAGFDTIVGNMEEGLRQQKSGQGSGRLTYAGLATENGLDKPSHKVVRVTESGETWVVYLDPESHLPALVQATGGNGDLLERYVFKDPVPGAAELSKADAFDPDARWGPSKGLLQRLARSNTATDEKTETR
jgi:hypothetical protein